MKGWPRHSLQANSADRHVIITGASFRKEDAACRVTPSTEVKRGMKPHTGGLFILSPTEMRLVELHICSLQCWPAITTFLTLPVSRRGGWLSRGGFGFPVWQSLAMQVHQRVTWSTSKL